LKFEELALPGAYAIELEVLDDRRGFFTRTFSRDEFRARGLNPEVVQCNLSYNRRRGTLRGLHFQAQPHPEAKLVHCTRGAIFDVIVDLRADSATRFRWIAVELRADRGRLVYVPEGLAHGFQTLEDDSEVYYLMSETYHADLARGVRWNDPELAISWPLPDPIMSERDRTLPLLSAVAI
jgi:dTDP-4-dehydrorhamnose 3,5-epimerase